MSGIWDGINDNRPRMSKESLDKAKLLFSKGSNTPDHYNNEKGSLYKIALERGWNAYQFDAIKRIDRAEKKGEFEKDIDKTIEVLRMYKEKI